MLDDRGRARILDRIALHRREQADASQARLERAPDTLTRFVAGGVEHEKSDESRGMTRHRGGDRRLVARHARDQRRAGDGVAIQLGDPSIRQRLRRHRRVPLGHLRAERLEEPWREEMDVTVVDHRMSFTSLIHAIISTMATRIKPNRQTNPEPDDAISEQEAERVADRQPEEPVADRDSQIIGVRVSPRPRSTPVIDALERRRRAERPRRPAAATSRGRARWSSVVKRPISARGNKRNARPPPS